MAKRHSDALFIANGAVNPSAIAMAIFEACQEIRAEPNHKGTQQLYDDPAIRLMVHQLSYLTKAELIDNSVFEACHKEVDADKAEALETR